MTDIKKGDTVIYRHAQNMMMVCEVIQIDKCLEDETPTATVREGQDIYIAPLSQLRVLGAATMAKGKRKAKARK